MKYDHKKIEKKWQKYWDAKKIYKTKTLAPRKKKFYVLDMFPYPSGEGLHVGHPKGYIATDIVSRTKRMQGFNVLHPMGFDAFGLPAENYALKNKTNPEIAVKKNIARYKKQLEIIGLDYDWSRGVHTTDPKYYKWTQWIFLQMFKKGLAYESYEPINWCPSCKTGLANEDVENGRCERCGTLVEKRPMRQWVLKITKYADRLLKDLDYLDWPEYIKESQRNWIGKSEGAEIEFPINPSPALPKGKGEFGYHTTDAQTWRALQERVLEMRKNPTEAEEKLWSELKTNKLGKHFRRQHIIGNFIVDFVCLEKSIIIEVDGDIHDFQQREDEERTKFLEQKGFRVMRFKNKEVLKNIENIIQKIGDFLEALPLGEGLGGVKIFTTRADTLYGATYLVLAPEHKGIENLKSKIENWEEVENYINNSKKKTEIDRTAENKEKTGVEIKGVKAVNPATGKEIPIFMADYVLGHYGTGAVMAVPAHDQRDLDFAKKFNLPVKEITIDEKTREDLAKKFGKKVVKYKLRDWVFSRQRYWGEPIPVLHGEDGEIIPVSEKELPVKLPKVKSYEPTGTGESPLANINNWVEVKKGKKKFKRETNTMPQWAGSSWYYLRYMDPNNNNKLVDPKIEKYWKNVDFYVGGAEHATRHLIYARFWHKFLYDLGVVSTKEPFKKLQSVGLIIGSDGRKMSKRFGNIINPDDIVKTWGADSLRLYEMFMGPFADAIAWNTDNMIGVRRFLERVWKLQFKTAKRKTLEKLAPSDLRLETLLHKTIKKVSEDIEEMKFNTAISAMMIFVNELDKENIISKPVFESFLKLLAPFAPHMADELWRLAGGKSSIHLQKWPKFDPRKIKEEKVIIVVQINGRVRAQLVAEAGVNQKEAEDRALALPEIKKWLEGKNMSRVIFVPDKILNLVVA